MAERLTKTSWFDNLTGDEQAQLEAAWNREKFNDDIVCPGCGEKWEDDGSWGEEGIHDCDCGKSFEYNQDISITYSTILIEDRNLTKEMFDRARKRMRENDDPEI